MDSLESWLQEFDQNQSSTGGDDDFSDLPTADDFDFDWGDFGIGDGLETDADPPPPLPDTTTTTSAAATAEPTALLSSPQRRVVEEQEALLNLLDSEDNVDLSNISLEQDRIAGSAARRESWTTGQLAAVAAASSGYDGDDGFDYDQGGAVDYSRDVTTLQHLNNVLPSDQQAGANVNNADKVASALAGLLGDSDDDDDDDAGPTSDAPPPPPPMDDDELMEANVLLQTSQSSRSQQQGFSLDQRHHARRKSASPAAAFPTLMDDQDPAMKELESLSKQTKTVKGLSPAAVGYAATGDAEDAAMRSGLTLKPGERTDLKKSASGAHHVYADFGQVNAELEKEAKKLHIGNNAAAANMDLDLGEPPAIPPGETPAQFSDDEGDNGDPAAVFQRDLDLLDDLMKQSAAEQDEQGDQQSKQDRAMIDQELDGVAAFRPSATQSLDEMAARLDTTSNGSTGAQARRGSSSGGTAAEATASRVADFGPEGTGVACTLSTLSGPNWTRYAKRRFPTDADTASTDLAGKMQILREGLATMGKVPTLLLARDGDLNNNNNNNASAADRRKARRGTLVGSLFRRQSTANNLRGVDQEQERARLVTALTNMLVPRQARPGEQPASSSSTGEKGLAMAHAISFHEIGISLDTIQSLRAALGHTVDTLQWLNVSKNTIRTDGFLMLMNLLLKRSVCLHTVVARFCSIGGKSAQDLLQLRPVIAANPSLRILDVSFNKLTDDGVIALLKALAARKQLVELDLSAVNMRERGCLVLAQFLQRNTQLKALRVSFNNITGAVLPLGKVIAQHPQLEVLDVSNCNLKQEGHFIFKGVAASLTMREFSISFNHLSNVAQQLLVKMLMAGRVMGTLQTLRVRQCELVPKCIAQMSKALATNSVLKSLDLAQNAIPEKVAKVVGTMLASNDTLRCLHLYATQLNSKGVHHIIRRGVAFCPSLRQICLDGFPKAKHWLVLFIDPLAQYDSQLEEITLRDAGVTAKDVRVFLESFKLTPTQKCSLKRLRIGANKLSRSQQEAIDELLYSVKEVNTNVVFDIDFAEAKQASTGNPRK